jgi:sugar phosphate isomerase/epimerase
MEFHQEKLAQMLGEMAGAGYAGFEIGAQRLENLNAPEKFLSQVQAAELEIAGIHTSIRQYLDGDLDFAYKVADFCQAVQAPYMLVSAHPQLGETQAGLDSLIEVLNQVGTICQERDLTYCYHNHAWEIINDQRILHTIVEQTDRDSVSLCLDIGWVKRADSSLVEVSLDFLDRIRYFHVKDTVDEKFTDLGEGSVDIQTWWQAVQGQGDFYLTYERDEVLPDAFSSAKNSRNYLRQIGI